MGTNKIKLVVEGGVLCRVVGYDDVAHLAIITPVEGAGGKWNDMQYDGVKYSELTEPGEEKLYQYVIHDITCSKTNQN